LSGVEDPNLKLIAGNRGTSIRMSFAKRRTCSLGMTETRLDL